MALINNTDCVPLYIGSILACGLRDSVIDLVVAKLSFLEEKYLIWNYAI